MAYTQLLSQNMFIVMLHSVKHLPYSVPNKKFVNVMVINATMTS